MIFTCCICKLNLKSIDKYQVHLRYHRNVPGAQFKCVQRNCAVICKTYAQFKNHIFRNHSNKAIVAHSKHVTLFTCNVTGCNYQNNDVKGFCKHVYNHVKRGVELKCPFVLKCKCETIFKNVNAIKQHICRKQFLHRELSPDNIKFQEPSGNHFDNDPGRDVASEVIDNEIVPPSRVTIE